VGYPGAGDLGDEPAIPAADYERRVVAFLDALDALDVDRVVVYGDREHPGNLASLCGFDPRFEEALLVLGGEQRWLLTGSEGGTLNVASGLGVTHLEVPVLGCMGIDRDGGRSLRDALALAGIRPGCRVGLVGWKATPAGMGAAVPGFVVEAVVHAAGPTGAVHDVSGVLLDAATGQRFTHGADRIAAFAWAATRASAAVERVIRGASPGLPETALMESARFDGTPHTYHPALASGSRLPAVLASPGDRIIERGDAVFVMVGMRGGNCARGGHLAADDRDLPPAAAAYLERVAIPYWRAVVAWYESVQVGRAAGEVRRRVEQACRAGGFEPALGVGHYVDWEDWPNTPFTRDPGGVLRGGMVIDCDIFSAANGPAAMVHCEDSVALADEALRAELAERHPVIWRELHRRQAFVRERLAIDLSDDVLPLSHSAAYLPPFWLSPDLALRQAS
jgi:hypothetical protein